MIGSTQLAFASSILWRIFKNNDTTQGWSFALFHMFITANLILAYFTGGPTHSFLIPFIVHNSATIAGLLYTTPNPLYKYLRRLTSGHVA